MELSLRGSKSCGPHSLALALLWVSCRPGRFALGCDWAWFPADFLKMLYKEHAKDKCQKMIKSAPSTDRPPVWEFVVLWRESCNFGYGSVHGLVYSSVYGSKIRFVLFGRKISWPGPSFSFQIVFVCKSSPALVTLCPSCWQRRFLNFS